MSKKNQTPATGTQVPVGNQQTSKSKTNQGTKGGGSIPTYPRHKINKTLPPMLGEDFRRLKNDIRQNGLKVPIVLHEGSILDGWNRYQICQDSNITPKFEEYQGTSPVMDCWILNMVRRHLTKGQLAALAVTYMSSLEKETKERRLNGLKQNRSRHDKSTTTDMDSIDQTLPDVGKGSIRFQVSKMLGVGETYIQLVKKVRKTNRELFDQLRDGKLTLPQVKREMYRQTERKLKDTSNIVIRKNDKRCTVYNCDLSNSPIKDGSLDAIITDPPYPKENLDCWTKLGTFASEKLKDGGILLAMSGNYYLPEVLENLKTEGLNFYWSLCYHMPDHGSTPNERKVRCHWKTVLWYVKGKYNRTFQPTDYFPDPYKACKEGKEFHEWGQSLPFFTTLVDKFTYADELVCDPFLGGGTTAIATLSLKRRFVGVELDPVAYRTSMKRIQDWESDPKFEPVLVNQPDNIVPLVKNEESSLAA